MEKWEVRCVLQYYRSIPGSRKMLVQEQQEIEAAYFGLRGNAMDGLPHGASVGKPVESVVLALEKSGDGERLREIGEKLRELDADQKAVRAALDGLNDRYKRVLVGRYVRGYSWGGMSARMGVADSTVRHWAEKGLVRLAEALENVGRPGLADRGKRSGV